jgi:hypothetical protein
MAFLINYLTDRLIICSARRIMRDTEERYNNLIHLTTMEAIKSLRANEADHREAIRSLRAKETYYRETRRSYYNARLRLEKDETTRRRIENKLKNIRPYGC